MYSRFNEAEKEKFLKLSEEDQMELVETFVNSVNDNMENKPNNQEKPVDGVIIKEKTFLQKYLIFIIIGAILLLVGGYFMFSGKSGDNGDMDF